MRIVLIILFCMLIITIESQTHMKIPDEPKRMFNCGNVTSYSELPLTYINYYCSGFVFEW